MNITVGAVLLIAIIVLIAYFFTTKTGKRLKLRAAGTADEAIQKDASTVEGAKAYYNAAIEKKEQDYQQAHTTYTQMLGKIQTYEEQLRSYQKENMQINIDIDNCIKKNDDNGAKVYLKRQQEIEEKIDIIKNALKELRENANLQKETVDDLFEQLGKLKSEKENAVLALETSHVTQSLQATPGIGSSEEDKMLEKVREGVRKATEQASGNKISYENSAAVQQKRLDKKMKDDEVERKLAELKSKRKG